MSICKPFHWAKINFIGWCFRFIFTLSTEKRCTRLNTLISVAISRKENTNRQNALWSHVLKLFRSTFSIGAIFRIRIRPTKCQNLIIFPSFLLVCLVTDVNCKHNSTTRHTDGLNGWRSFGSHRLVKTKINGFKLVDKVFLLQWKSFLNSKEVFLKKWERSKVFSIDVAFVCTDKHNYDTER